MKLEVNIALHLYCVIQNVEINIGIAFKFTQE